MFYGLFQLLWNGLTGLAGLFVPLVGKARELRAFGPRVRWTLHFLLIGAILVGLGFLNYWLDLEKYLEARWLLLRRLWLPVLFLIAYLLAWLAYWLWRQFGPDQDPVEFPDIDAAWTEAVLALDRAGVDLAALPVFLVLGRPAAGEEALFDAGHRPLQLRHVPRDPAAPLHVSADAEGIYVTCAGASLLGRQSAILAGQFDVEEEPEPLPVLAPAGPLRPAPAAAMAVTQAGAATPAEKAAAPARQRRRRAAPEPAKAAELAPDDDDVHARVRRPRLLRDAAEVARQRARLRYLCRLIARERLPACPINGVLTLIPFAALDSDTDAIQTGQLCQMDLAVVRDACRVECSLFALVCDLERAPGFRELRRRFPAALRQRRVGQQFPYVPGLDAAGAPPLLEAGVAWVFRHLLPPLVYRLFRVGEGDADDGRATAGNVRLYKFLRDVEARQARLARLLVLGMAPPAGAALRLAGCYLGGTGRDPRQQGFVGGVFRRLVESQDYVSWTAQALERERDYRRWTAFGYLGLALALLALVTVGTVLTGRR